MTAVSPLADAATERLNYRNGQRIEAVDLRVEQAYHIGVRRWLNRSLYTAGIAKGLEVKPHANPHMVTVMPGLAFDQWGREIILTTATEVLAKGAPRTAKGVVFGNYLVIEYAEERGAPGAVECSDGVTAPTRIRAVPKITMQDAWPGPESGKIPLAQIELDGACAVTDVHIGIRRYATSSKPQKVRALSLEGEKDINPQNSKRFSFHISGSNPESATLYLQADRFSTLFYSEIAEHTHGINLITGNAGAAGGHRHDIHIGEIRTSGGGEHRHEIRANTEDHGGALELQGADDTNVALTGPGGVLGGNANMEVLVSGWHDHTLAVPPLQTEPAGDAGNHTHGVNGTTGAHGQGGSTTARPGGSQYRYFSDLKIRFDDEDITDRVLAQIKARRPAGEDWNRFGSGLQGHPLVIGGTGEIDLMQLGLDLSPRAHTLEFVPGSGGGQIRYNLYIE